MKRVAGFPNYAVTEDGKIWSDNRGRFLVGGKDKDGYRILVLCSNGKRSTKRVHRLVAEAFIPNPDNLPVLNHIDGDKTNNCVENLEWCDVSHNTKHAYKLGALCQKGEKNNGCKYNDLQVRSIREGYKGGSIAAYARELEMPYAVVYSYLKDLRRS